MSLSYARAFSRFCRRRDGADRSRLGLDRSPRHRLVTLGLCLTTGSGMRTKRLLVRAFCAFVVIECVLVASYATASAPLPVPVDGVSHAAVPHDFHAPRPGFHSAHQGTDLL